MFANIVDCEREARVLGRKEEFGREESRLTSEDDSSGATPVLAFMLVSLLSSTSSTCFKPLREKGKRLNRHLNSHCSEERGVDLIESSRVSTSALRRFRVYSTHRASFRESAVERYEKGEIDASVTSNHEDSSRWPARSSVGMTILQ